MATPKTPRKRVEKPAQVKDVAEKAVADPVADSPFDQTPEQPIADIPAVDEPMVTLDEPKSQEPEVIGPTEPTTTPEPAPKFDPPRDTPQPQVVKSSPGFVPLVLGGVVAAGIGFGLARYVVPDGWPLPNTSPLQSQVTQQAADIADLRAEVQALPQDASADLRAEVEQLRAASTAALQKAEAARQPEAQDFGPEIADLTSRIAALEDRPTVETTADPAAIEALKTDIATLRSGLEQQKANAETMAEAAKTARAEATAEAQTILLQAALTKVEAAMNSGAPFADPLAMLADAGVAIPQILSDNAENGVPTVTALTESFDAPARAALEESLRSDMGSTWSDRVGTFLRTQTGARSLTPQEGNDPDAILSRAGAAVAAGDLQTALTEIAALPEPAQIVLADWTAQVKLRLEAQTATAELATALSER